jgi:hypothetical protein
LPGDPLTDPAWRREFLRRTSYAAVSRYYLNHPARMCSILWADLQHEAGRIRAPNLGNFRREDGRRPGEKARSFDIWSNFRSHLFQWWPAHAIAWYSVIAAACLAVIWKSKQDQLKKVASLCLLVLVLGAGEYGLASLADSCETHRHLLLFHAATDTSFCMAVLGLLAWRPGPKSNLRY